jgi:hypothetical protein
MNVADLLVGALTLKTQVFTALRERSDVFYRGFLVLLLAALVAGAFGALGKAIGDVRPLATKAQLEQVALDQFNSRFNGSQATRAQIEPYVIEIADMIYDVRALPPQAGEAARPVGAVLDYVGNLLATPFTTMFVGTLLFAGLLFQLTSRWLGGQASMAQMLGLTALAAAPHLFTAVVNLLNLLASAGGIGIFAGLASVIAAVLSIWSAAIYVKATAVAQQFSIWRALGAIALGVGILVAIVIVLGIVITIGLIAVFAIAGVTRS